MGPAAAAQHHTSVTDPPTAKASELLPEEAALAAVGTEGRSPADVAGRSDSSGLAMQEGAMGSADERQQQADAAATSAGQAGTSSQPEAPAGAKSVDSSLTSPGSFSA